MRVSASMFASTLGIPARTVLLWFNTAEQSMPLSPVHASKQTRTTGECAVKAGRKRLAEEFICKIDKVPSHYCRKSSNKQYLWPGDFASFADVHHKYKAWLKEKFPSEQPVSMTTLKVILKAKNIDIFQPRKDQCDLCVGYRQGNVGEEKYRHHLLVKDEARAAKAKDKEQAMSDSSCLVVTVDVQAVQTLPKTEASCLYFKTRLNVHNYTVYNVASGEVICYVWPECNGGLTASVFTTCLLDFLEKYKSLQPHLQTVTIWSDGCGCQNRNATLISAVASWAAKNSIDCFQKYLCKGHSQMEVDSVHAKLEARMRKVEVQIPADYCRLITEARKHPRPYRYQYLDHTFFRNFEADQMYESIRPGTKKGDPCVTDVKQYHCKKDGTIQYKLSHSSTEEFQILPHRRRRSVPSTRSLPLYNTPIPLPARKFKDLQELKPVLHPNNHAFYDSLPHL